MNNTLLSALARQRSEASDMRSHGRTHPLHRAAFAAFVARSDPARSGGPGNVAKALYPGDRAVEIILKGDQEIVGTAGAGALAQVTTAGFFASLPASAAGRLIAASDAVPLEPLSEIKLPQRSGGAGALSWIAQGAPR